MPSALFTSVSYSQPSSCCEGATSWWCFSTLRPMSDITVSISARRSWAPSTGATGEFLVGDVGPLLAVDLVERGVHRVLEEHVVEDEELGLGAEERLVANAGGGEIGLGLLRRRARIAAIGLPGAGLVHVAENHQLGLRREGIEHGGGAIRLQQHVALVDRLPAGDRRAVEHHALV